MLQGKKIAIIYACSAFAQNGRTIIGKNGDVPWRGQIPSDMKRFKELTAGQSVVMGRKTWDSLPTRFKPLPDRQNLIITRNPQFSLDEKIAIITNSLKEAVQRATSETVWIIGGAEIYALALPKADLLHVTIVYEKFEGDAFFPKYDIDKWRNEHFEHFRAGGAGAERDTVHSSYLVFQRTLY